MNRSVSFLNSGGMLPKMGSMLQITANASLNRASGTRDFGTGDNAKGTGAGGRGGATGAAETNAAMFADAGALKEQAHKNLDKPEYDVSMYYKESGLAQLLARSSVFGNLTLFMITCNALWIGADTEWNTEDNLTEAEWYFQLGEYAFTAFFSFEWTVRFLAFEQKRNGLRDRWFCFDSFLVALMLFETFVVPYALAPKQTASTVSTNSNSTGTASGDESAGTDMSQLSMLRMMRLLRLTRMVRLMRAVPELVTLLKSMKQALRSVLSTLALLLIFMYIFAIIFKSQLSIDKNYQYRGYLVNKFGRVPDAMWTLLLHGTFLDDITTVANRLLDASPLMCVVLMIFVMLSSFTILNLLVGLLCEVVDAVAEAEKEKVMISYVKSKLMSVLDKLDEDGNGTISKDEFDQLITIPEAVQALTELGVDVQNLVSLSEHLFSSDDIAQTPKPRESSAEVDIYKFAQIEKSTGDVDGKELLESNSESISLADNAEGGEEEEASLEMTNAEFLEMVIRLRSTNQPSVVDVVDLRKLIVKSQKDMMRRLETLEEMSQSLNAQIHVVNETLYYLSSKDCMPAIVDWCSRNTHGNGSSMESGHASNRKSRPESPSLLS